MNLIELKIQLLIFFHQIPPPPFLPPVFIVTKKWHCHSSNHLGQKHGIIPDFAFSLIPHIQSITYTVRFFFEMYAKSDPFLPSLLLPSWPNPPSALISTIARATSLDFSPHFLLYSGMIPLKHKIISFCSHLQLNTLQWLSVSSGIKSKALASGLQDALSLYLHLLPASLTLTSHPFLFHSSHWPPCQSSAPQRRGSHLRPLHSLFPHRYLGGSLTIYSLSFSAQVCSVWVPPLDIKKAFFFFTSLSYSLTLLLCFIFLHIICLFDRLPDRM